MSRDARPLPAQRPLFMVPRRYTFSVVIYIDGVTPPVDLPAAVRDGLVNALPRGIGVGAVSCADHGIVMLKEDES